MEHDLSFSPSSSTDGGSYKLMELPQDLCKVIEDSFNPNSTPFSFSVKGQPGEDAVLCTSEKTYTMRSVILSNSVLIVTPPPDALSADFPDDAVVIRDQVNEIIELAPSVPKLYKLGAILRGRDYDEHQEDEDENDENENKDKFTYEDAKSQIQASDAELDHGLKVKHILNIRGELRPISPSYLARLLQLFLNLLVSLALSLDAAHVERLSSALADEHQIPRTVSTQIMSWFGDIKEGKWKVNIESVIKEVGLETLRRYKDEPIEKDILLAEWKGLVGDTYECYVSLSLLSGNYLATPNDVNKLKYFPASSLPVDPPSRFADLFLTRSRWKVEDISPFLVDIAINSKERDKLLLKFARGTTDAEGVWYTARAQYNG